MLFNAMIVLFLMMTLVEYVKEQNNNNATDSPE